MTNLIKRLKLSERMVEEIHQFNLCAERDGLRVFEVKRGIRNSKTSYALYRRHLISVVEADECDVFKLTPKGILVSAEVWRLKR